MASACNGAALMASAIQSAIRAKAPRRTVAAVAAAVANVFVHRPTASQVATSTREKPDLQDEPKVPSDSTEELMQALRNARAAKRRQKRQRRIANRLARAGGVEGGSSREMPHCSTAGDVVLCEVRQDQCQLRVRVHNH